LHRNIGPGATNLVTGIATAMLDSVPMVCITGQVNSKLIGSDAFQETDITGVTLPITKHNYVVSDVNKIASTIREAFYIARSGRPGPVLVDITKDAQQATTVPVWSEEPVRLPGYRPDHRAGEEDLDRAADMIKSARRPLILAVTASCARSDSIALDFVEKTGVPVASTLLASAAFPRRHPLSLGMMGMHGEAWVNQAIQEADLLLALGMRFDDRVTGNLKTYAVHAKKIHFELDPAEINKNVRVDLRLVGDVKDTLRALLPRIKQRNCKPWIDRITTLKGDSAVRDIQKLPHDEGSSPPTSFTIFGASQKVRRWWSPTLGSTKCGKRSITSTIIRANSLPPAVWERWDSRFRQPSAPASPEKMTKYGSSRRRRFSDDCMRTFHCGSRRYQDQHRHHQQWLFGKVRQWQEFFYDGRYSATPLRSPDFVKLAEAHGHTGLRVTKREQLEEVVAQARSTPGTVLIDFRVEQEDSVYPMVAAGADLNDMIRRPIPSWRRPMTNEMSRGISAEGNISGRAVLREDGKSHD